MFSLSGKSKNQIPCFPCAVATLLVHVFREKTDSHGRKRMWKFSLMSVTFLWSFTLGVNRPQHVFKCLTVLFTDRNEVLAKVIFLHLSVILLMGGGSIWPDTPPPGPDTHPRTRHASLGLSPSPLGLSPPPRTKYTPPGLSTAPLPGAADSGIRSTFGRYASYWNAFLCVNVYSVWCF